MEKNIEKSSEVPFRPNLQNSLKDSLHNKWLKVSLMGLLGFVLLAGVFYVGTKVNSQKRVSESSQPVSQDSSSLPVVSKLPTPSQEAIKPANNQKTAVTAPDEFGFTKTLELKGIGVKAKFPQNVTVSLQEENLYVIRASESDAVTFGLKDYDGGGRRAWFLREYPWTKNYAIESFVGSGHGGYIAYATKPEERPGAFFYFSVVSSAKMLVVSGNNFLSNNVNPTLGNTSVFFTSDIQKFKSFLSTIELTSTQNIVLENYPEGSDLYRWSDTRKTIWEDSTLGLKITTPEWTESRYTRDRDANGEFTYTDWGKTYPEAKTYDSIYFSENIKRIDVTGAYLSPQYLSVLSLKYQDKSFSDVVNELLIPAGFCTSEWKSSESECADTNYCYTRDEVAQNLVVEKQVKIGTLDAQLRNMNQDFSNKNDCRSEDTWLIKAKNGQFVLSNISPDGETIRIESL